MNGVLGETGILAFLLLMTLPFVVIIGGVTLGVVAMNHRARLKELAYRERIAMIERGLVPPPEVDPKQFERTMGPPNAVHDVGLSARDPSARYRSYRSGGVLLIAIGLGVLLIVSFAGEAPGPGIGVGGAIMVVGAALLLNAFLARNDRPLPVPPPREPAPPQDES